MRPFMPRGSRAREALQLKKFLYMGDEGDSAEWGVDDDADQWEDSPARGSPRVDRDDWPELSAYQGKTIFPKQYHAVMDEARFVHMTGAVRSGKTHGAARAFIRRIVRHIRSKRRDDFCVLAPTYRLTIPQKKHLIKLIPSWQVDWKRQGGDDLWLDEKKGGGTICLKGGCTIRILSAEDPESIIAFEFMGGWVTEAARVKYKALHNLRSRFSNHLDSWCYYDTAPFGRCAYYIDLLEPTKEGKTPDSSYHFWTASESPFIPPQEIEHARATMPERFFRRDYLGSWDTFEGQIYSEWDDAIHLRDEPYVRPTHALVVVDLNTADSSPAAFLTMVYGKKDGDVQGVKPRTYAFVESEYYRYGLGLDFEGYANAIAAQVKALKARGLKVSCRVDPSIHNGLKAMLHSRGVDPMNADNDVLPGIRNMGMALHPRSDGPPLLTVSRRCTNFVTEIKGYSWTVTSDGVVKEAPNKGLNDHLMDCARYASMDLWDGLGETRQLR